jgi:GT2 family glycosyltransferase
MSYDLIIISQSSPALIPTTQQCIDTARADGADMNVIVVETGQPYIYNGCDKHIEYNGEFNYNRALNMGLKYATKEIHILANNDIIFRPGWSKIGDLMKANDFHSASAFSGHLSPYFKQGDFVYEGYQVGYILAGWCIFLDDHVLGKIGKLDESVSFWFSDNLYACQIKAAGIRHGLFTGVSIDHMASQTLNKQPSRKQRQYQIGELSKFNNRAAYYATRERIAKTNPANI